ncbi:MAG: class I SAM-dependent methyltransferase [Lachnospiraceae bacterium]|nr:class I SAM-dependent methyltransferase [Lachnospiraceae bacterium]
MLADLWINSVMNLWNYLYQKNLKCSIILVMKDYEALSKKHFNNQAYEYDSNNSYYYSKEGKISSYHIEEYLKNKTFNSLLDVGCGTGFLIDLLSNEHKNAEFYGLDLSDKMIEVANSKRIKNSTFMVGKSNELPYDDEYFDIVVCSQSFHHYPYQDEAVKEAYRVLKKDGIYILSDSGVGGLGAWIDNNIIFKLLPSGDCKVTNKKGIEKILERHKFQIIESEKLTWMVYCVVGKK